MSHSVRAEIIYSPHSGQGFVRRELDDVVSYLAHKGWTVDKCEVNKPMEATERTRDAVKRGANVVIAAGGDGTVHEVANGLVGTDSALGVLPTGTTNTWALQMHIPTLNPILPGMRTVKFIADLEDRIAQPLPANYYRRVLLNAAKVLTEENIVTVDVGKIADRYFLMWAGIGIDATVAERMSMKQKRVLGYWAYVIPAVGTLRRYHGTDIWLNMDGEEIKTNASLILVSNIRLYGGGFPVGVKAQVNDAKLDVCIFPGDGILTFVRHVLKVLSRRHSNDSKIKYYQCSRLEIVSDNALRVHADSEVFTETPVTISVVQSALRTIVPQNAPNSLFVA